MFPLGVGIAALFRRDGHPLLWVIQGALYTAIGITVVAVQRRRVSRAAGTDPHSIAELNRRIRHRDVPSEPGERVVMRRLVAEHLRQMERGGRWLPYWLGAMVLIAAGVLALGVAAGSYTLPLILAVGMIGFCCWILWTRRRSMDRCRSMRSALRAPGERVP